MVSFINNFLLKYLLLLIIFISTINGFTQGLDKKSTIYFCRSKDYAWFNWFAKICIDDSLFLGIGKGEIISLRLLPGTYDISLCSQKNKEEKIKIEEGKNYYYKVIYNLNFFSGSYELLQLSPEFGELEINTGNYKIVSRVIEKK